MTVATRIRWRGTVKSLGEVGSLIPETGDVVLVSRGGTRRWLVFRCPSGCGLELPINLDSRAGPSWRIYNPGPAASLYPSVWRESDCRAHFILSRGRLWVFGDDDDLWTRTEFDENLIAKVHERLTEQGDHYFDIAEAIGAEPWDTLRACMQLVKRGKAIAGGDKEQGRYRKGSH